MGGDFKKREKEENSVRERPFCLLHLSCDENMGLVCHWRTKWWKRITLFTCKVVLVLQIFFFLEKSDKMFHMFHSLHVADCFGLSFLVAFFVLFGRQTGIQWHICMHTPMCARMHVHMHTNTHTHTHTHTQPRIILNHYIQTFCLPVQA